MTHICGKVFGPCLTVHSMLETFVSFLRFLLTFDKDSFLFVAAQ